MSTFTVQVQVMVCNVFDIIMQKTFLENRNVSLKKKTGMSVSKKKLTLLQRVNDQRRVFIILWYLH